MSINEYGDDGFADPETDIEFDDETEPEVSLAEVEAEVEAALLAPLAVEHEPPSGVYYLVDNGVVVETLDAQERWGRHLLDGQVVVAAADFDG